MIHLNYIYKDCALSIHCLGCHDCKLDIRPKTTFCKTLTVPFINVDFCNYEGYEIVRFKGIIIRVIEESARTILLLIVRCVLAIGYFSQLAGSVVNHIFLTYTFLRLGVPDQLIKVFSGDLVVGISSPVYPTYVTKILDSLGIA